MDIAEALHLPPIVPTKIICVHLNHSSRVKEIQITLLADADLLPQAGVFAQLARVSGRAAEPLQMAELRGRDRDRDRPPRATSRPKEAGDYIRGYSDRQRLRPA